MDRVYDYFHVAVKGTEKQFVEQMLIVWLRFQCQRKGRRPRSLQSRGSVLQHTVVWSRKWGPKEAPASARVGESVLLYVPWCDAVWNEASAPSPPPPPPRWWGSQGATAPRRTNSTELRWDGFPCRRSERSFEDVFSDNFLFWFLSPLLPSQYVAQTGLKLTTPMPWARESWDYMCATMLHYF